MDPIVHDHGSIAILLPVTAAATDWMALVIAHRFPVVTGVGWMAAPPPSVRTTHFVLRYRVPLDGTGLPYLRAEEVSA